MLGRFPRGESGPIPAEHRSDVEQTLLQKIAAAGQHITTGFIGNKYAWPALSGMGEAHLALDLALKTTCPSYGYQVANGATTLCAFELYLCCATTVLFPTAYLPLR